MHHRLSADNLMYPFVYLGKYLVKNGHRINTIDMDNIKNFDAIVFLDFPGFKNKYFNSPDWMAITLSVEVNIGLDKMM